MTDITAVFLAVLAAAVMARPGKAGTRLAPQVKNSLPNIIGTVVSKPLRFFELPALKAASNDLQQPGPWPAAAAAFAADVARNPNDLAGWVGLYQANPDRWAADEPELVAQVKARAPDATAVFRLAALRYYRAQAHTDDPKHKLELAAAARLFLRSWRLAREPMAGFMLLENIQFFGPFDLVPQYDAVFGKLQTNLLQELSSELMGADAYRAYVRAKKFALDADPPPAKMTPRGNWTMLCCLLRWWIPPAKHYVYYLAPHQPGHHHVVFLSREAPLTHQMVLDRRYYGKWLQELGAKVPVY
ncbi:MAG: hypothetical protein KGJ62_01025 [Armatimonadetes bacterium]|nr:hypothetical protein [Armatimonadota bacterium]